VFRLGPFFTIVSSGVLLLAILATFQGPRKPQERSFHSRLENLLPPAPGGWARVVRPIADTVEMQNAVNRVLNYDDAVFADYTRGADRVSIFMAYWVPDKMSYRLVAGHTPDICWVGNGWQRTGTAGTAILNRTGGQALPPAEKRTFELSGRTEHVWFWHLVSARVFSYGTGGMPPWHAIITDLFRRDLDPRGEQFFIRISASAPITEPRLRPASDVILDNLPLP